MGTSALGLPGSEPVSGINSLAVGGAAEKYGGRSGPTSQREPISPSPHRLWACVDRYLGVAAPVVTPHLCTCLPAPWLQQLVENVSLRQWTEGISDDLHIHFRYYGNTQII